MKRVVHGTPITPARLFPSLGGEFASFCQLKPGRYRYKIVRPERLENGLDAARRLEGEIIVGNPKGKDKDKDS